MFNDHPLTLNSDAFNALKNDFNQMLRATLSSMEQKEAEEGTITVKLGISLLKDHVPDPTIVTYEAEREIIRPKFDHKVTATIQYKSEKTGTLSGDYELVWDRAISEWVMRPITNGQMNLFEDGDPGATPGANAPPPGLPPGAVAALPPSGAIDAEYTVVGVNESTKNVTECPDNVNGTPDNVNDPPAEPYEYETPPGEVS